MDDRTVRIVDAAFELFMRHGFRKVTMGDIADAVGISRPTLYKAFANKEAVFVSQVEETIARNRKETKKRLARRVNLKSRIEAVFEIWIVTPFASVIDSENGKDLLLNGTLYAPGAIERIYAEFESQLLDVLAPVSHAKQELSAEDLAHILMLSAKGLKASVGNLPGLKRMIQGLVTMTLAVVG